MRCLLLQFECLLMVLFHSAGSQPVAAAPNVLYGDDTTFAAIAYSEDTGKIGYATECASRNIAETLAKRRCGAEDAKPVGWVNNGFCALAIGDEGAWGTGYSFGDGASNKAAKQRALEKCAEHGDHPRVVLCVCSVSERVEVGDGIWIHDETRSPGSDD
ncbi:MAG: DUF4189 domain-containing protein [Planctomycetales bacterium]|nr:DUF4189 domain-containing protein [Planctomycetales bacterium]